MREREFREMCEELGGEFEKKTSLVSPFQDSKYSEESVTLECKNGDEYIQQKDKPGYQGKEVTAHTEDGSHITGDKLRYDGGTVEVDGVTV